MATTAVQPELAARATRRSEAQPAVKRGPTAFAAEAIGTFLLVFFICGVLSVGNAGVLQLDIAGLGLLHALTLMVLVYALAATSGAHFNPAVTVGMLAVRQIRLRDAVGYISCQLVGGMLAGLSVLLLFHHAGASVNYGATTVNAKVLAHGSAWLGAIAEAIGTFMLMWAIMAVAVNPRAERHVAGLAIGGALGLAVMVFGPATGAGFNPARSLGPAVASGVFSNFWIYIAGPLAGAVLAAVGYRTLVLDRQAPEPQPAHGALNGGPD